MRLIIGGMAQGKLACAKQITGAVAEQVLDGACCALSGEQNALVLDGVHTLVRRCMEANINATALLEVLVENNPELVITAREIGCGIVPLEPNERIWREQVGRICCMLAVNATHVDRVVCGLLISIKAQQE